MPDSTAADATRPYLEYLEREMTIHGILSTFCIAAIAAALDRVLAVAKASAFITNVQTVAFPYFLGALIALAAAAWFFYWQRSDLAWLNGQIALAVARDLRALSIPAGAWSLEQLLEEADSWTIWTHYMWGLTLLAVSAAEIVLVFIMHMFGGASPFHWLGSTIPLLIGVAVVVFQGHDLKRKDQAPNIRRRRPN